MKGIGMLILVAIAAVAGVFFMMFLSSLVDSARGISEGFGVIVFIGISIFLVIARKW